MLDHLPTRIVSGILTASMTLSLLTGISGPGAAAVIEAAQQAKTRNQADVETAASKTDLEGAEIPMPLVLDKTSIGFTQGYEETEVTAYMTDIQYLGLLSIEEYAAFFPASLNLERVEYLSRDQRKYMATLDEPRRLSLRAQAEAKLKLKEQFVWEAMFGEEDYSDELSFEPVSWTIYDASETTAPMISCRVKVTWTGEKPTQAPSAGVLSDADLAQQLLNGANTEDTTGSKSIYD